MGVLKMLSNNETVLITGGAGFVGTNLSMAIKDKFNIKIIDNFSTKSQNLKYLENFTEIINGDIRNELDCEKALKGVSYVIHLAAKGNVVQSVEDPVGNMETNVLGTLKLLEKAVQHDIKRFVFSSTGGALMGNCQLPVSETSIPKPISPYGASKLACEGYLSAYSDMCKMPTTVLRFGNVYGKYCSHKVGVFNKIMDSVINQKDFAIFGDGSASRDFIHVTDISNAIDLAITHGKDLFETYHIGTETETSIIELVNLFERISGTTINKKFLPERKGEVALNFSTPKLAREKLGFQPRITLEQGLSQLWSWYSSIY